MGKGKGSGSSGAVETPAAKRRRQRQGHSTVEEVLPYSLKVLLQNTGMLKRVVHCVGVKVGVGTFMANIPPGDYLEFAGGLRPGGSRGREGSRVRGPSGVGDDLRGGVFFQDEPCTAKHAKWTRLEEFLLPEDGGDMAELVGEGVVKMFRLTKACAATGGEPRKKLDIMTAPNYKFSGMQPEPGSHLTASG